MGRVLGLFDARYTNLYTHTYTHARAHTHIQVHFLHIISHPIVCIQLYLVFKGVHGIFNRSRSPCKFAEEIFFFIVVLSNAICHRLIVAFKFDILSRTNQTLTVRSHEIVPIIENYWKLWDNVFRFDSFEFIEMYWKDWQMAFLRGKDREDVEKEEKRKGEECHLF